MKKSPNVIVFFTDQQRYDTTGIHGNPLNLTPNFDRMAREGTFFRNAFSPQPVCLPCRAVMQTGQYASALGIYDNTDGLQAETKTLGSYFKEAGYQTAYIGKWHIYKSHQGTHVPPEYRRGYDYWLGANTVELHTDAYYAALHDNAGNEVFLPGYRADAYTDAAIRYIYDRRDDQIPFFLFLSLLEPHSQNTRNDYPAPTGYEEQYVDSWTPPDLKTLTGTALRNLPGYYGMVKRVDEALGRLQDALHSMNLSEETIILFATDHGCHFSTRNVENKRSCHDASIRLPMAAIGPRFNGGHNVCAPVSLVDVPPTLLDACNISVPETMQGGTLLPLVKGNAAEVLKEAYVEVYNEGWLERCVRTKRWMYGIRRTSFGRENMYDNWEFQAEYLFDQKADPWQLENLAGVKEYADVETVLRERLLKRMHHAGEPEPVILPADERSFGQRCRLLEHEKYE